MSQGPEDPVDAAHADRDLDPMWAEPHEWWRRTTLRDGRKVLVRQLRPQDRERLAEGLRRLSPASRYLRFHAHIDELTEEQLDYLTAVDHVDHEALVALDVEDPEAPGIGVARYIREVYEPRVAEAAITVSDDYHGQGAGTILLGALAARARTNGIEVFRSYVLDGNSAMLEVFDHLGAHRERETDGLWRVDLDVPTDEGDVPRSGAGRAFLEAARGERRMVSLLPPIWSRWRAARRRQEEDRADDLDEAGDPDEAGVVDDEAGVVDDEAGVVDDEAGVVDDEDRLRAALEREAEDLEEGLDGWLRHRDER